MTIDRIIVVEPPARAARCEICAAAHAEISMNGHRHRAVPARH